MKAGERVGLLFDFDWDALAHDRIAAAAGISVERAGFDLFTFPSNVRLAFFDLERFAAAQARRARQRGWRAVVSHHEQFGALAAALVAEATGLPGTSPESVIACQHKAHARRVLQRVAPEATPAFELLEVSYGDAIPEGLRYPAFAKPVKAAFSVLARRVESRDELAAHARFDARERWVIRHLVEPFERVARTRLPGAGTAHRLILEEPVGGMHVNLDGWVQGGQLHVLGCVDAQMFPGTQAFMRWDLPSRLPASGQERAADVARRFLSAIGFTLGFFNLEFFVDERSGRMSVIEFNPRLASQFGDLYRRVLGRDPHAMALAMAMGEDAGAVRVAAPTAGAAASFVYRAFDPARIPPMPTAAQREALRKAYPDALLFVMPKSGRALQRDFKWLGNHRYGLLHLGGRDTGDLRARCEHASALLGWPLPYADESVALGGVERNEWTYEGALP